MGWENAQRGVAGTVGGNILREFHALSGQKSSRFVKALSGSNVEGIEDEGRRIISALRAALMSFCWMSRVQRRVRSMRETTLNIGKNSGAKQIAFVWWT